MLRFLCKKICAIDLLQLVLIVFNGYFILTDEATKSKGHKK